MNRRLVLPFVILAGLAPLSCASSASSGPGIYWSEFAATEVNFQHYFDEAERDLQQIEGIWSPETWSRGQFAIVRNSSYPEYDYVAVRIIGRGQGRGEIVAALRSTGLDLPIYEYACADVVNSGKTRKNVSVGSAHRTGSGDTRSSRRIPAATVTRGLAFGPEIEHSHRTQQRTETLRTGADRAWWLDWSSKSAPSVSPVF